MPWLVKEERVIASLEIADSPSKRMRGLLGRAELDGAAMLLAPARGVHTFGMRFPLDIAFCDADLVVLEICTVAAHRLTRPRLRARQIIEAEAGAFARWDVRVGDLLDIRVREADESDGAVHP